MAGLSSKVEEERAEAARERACAHHERVAEMLRKLDGVDLRG